MRARQGKNPIQQVPGLVMEEAELGGPLSKYIWRGQERSTVNSVGVVNGLGTSWPHQRRQNPNLRKRGVLLNPPSLGWGLEL